MLDPRLVYVRFCNASAQSLAASKCGTKLPHTYKAIQESWFSLSHNGFPKIGKCSQYMFGLVQVLLASADKDYPKAAPPPLRFIRSCSSALAPATLHKLEAAFGVPVLEVRFALPC